MSKELYIAFIDPETNQTQADTSLMVNNYTGKEIIEKIYNLYTVACINDNNIKSQYDWDNDLLR